jgi:uncharacterized protein (UPF0218 family)
VASRAPLNEASTVSDPYLEEIREDLVKELCKAMIDAARNVLETHGEDPDLAVIMATVMVVMIDQFRRNLHPRFPEAVLSGYLSTLAC